jgi:hypothetical protein
MACWRGATTGVVSIGARDLLVAVILISQMMIQSRLWADPRGAYAILALLSLAVLERAAP